MGDGDKGSALSWFRDIVLCFLFNLAIISLRKRALQIFLLACVDLYSNVYSHCTMGHNRGITWS